MSPLKVKVCGMKYPENAKEVAALNPDYLGMIFFAKSPRYLVDTFPLDQLPVFGSVKKVGVFVKEEVNALLEIASNYDLHTIQLHGGESVEDCEAVKKAGYQVVKVFSVGEAFDFAQLNEFKPVVDYFLFDTQCKEYGGSGKKFDWRLLDGYDNEKPFWLSGGIGLEDVSQIAQACQSFNIDTVDVNSRFETKPGWKDVNLLTTFIEEIRAL